MDATESMTGTGRGGLPAGTRDEQETLAAGTGTRWEIGTGGRRAILVAMLMSKAARAMLAVLLGSLAALHYRTRFGLEPLAFQAFTSLAFLPGLARPLFALAGDDFPVMERRRGPQAIAGAASSMISAMLLGFSNPMDPALLGAACILYGMGDALMDVAFDSLAIDAGKADPEMKNETRLWMRGGAVAGAMVGFLFGGVFLETTWNVFVSSIVAVLAVTLVLSARIPEPRWTRAAIIAARHRGTRSAGTSRPGGGVFWLAGLLILVPAAGEQLVNVAFEPWLVDRIESNPAAVFLADGTGFAIATLLLAVLASRPAVFKPGKVLLPALCAVGFIQVAYAWLTPDIGWYLAWSAIGTVPASLVTLGVDRVLMDTVRGARAGATFQLYVIFLYGGASLGPVAGALLGTVMPVQWLLVLSGCLFAASGVAYKLMVEPRLREPQA